MPYKDKADPRISHRDFIYRNTKRGFIVTKIAVIFKPSNWKSRDNRNTSWEPKCTKRDVYQKLMNHAAEDVLHFACLTFLQATDIANILLVHRCALCYAEDVCFAVLSGYELEKHFLLGSTFPLTTLLGKFEQKIEEKEKKNEHKLT